MNDKLARLISKTSLRQLFSYVLVGALTNLIGYAIYLFLTYHEITPKLAITVLYPIGAIIGFFGNKRFTFRHNGHIGTAGIRFLIAQLLGYLLNLLLLMVFVDKLGFPHQIIEAFAIVTVALFLFLISRFFVFV